MNLPLLQLARNARRGGYFAEATKIGIPMPSGTLLHLLKVGPCASPAELVATRVLAEFAERGEWNGILALDYLTPEMIVLTAQRPLEAPRAAERVRCLLGERRFAGWELVVYGE